MAKDNMSQCPFCTESLPVEVNTCPHCQCVIQTEKDLVEGGLLGDEKVLNNAITRFRKEIESHPNKGILYYYLACAMKNRGLVTAAKDAFEKAMSISPEIPSIYYELFWIYKYQGNLPRAVDYIKQAVILDKENVLYNLNAGINLKRRGEKLMAVECLERAYRKKPSDITAISELGAIYFELNKMDKACEVYENWLRIDPASEEALKFLTEIYESQQNVDGLLDIYKRILEKDPDNIEYLYILAYKLKDLKKYEEAIKYLERIVLLNPGYVHEKHARIEDTPKMLLASCYQDYAEILQGEKKLDDAIPYLEKSLELNPKNPVIYQMLGDLCFIEKKISSEKVFRYFENGVLQYPQNDFLLVNLGILYNSIDKEKSRLYLSKSRSFKPAYDKEVLESALLAWSEDLEKNNKLDGAIQKMEQILEFTNNTSAATARVEFLRSKWRDQRESFYKDRQRKSEERERSIREKKELEEMERRRKIATRKRLAIVWTVMLVVFVFIFGLCASWLIYQGKLKRDFGMQITYAQDKIKSNRLDAVQYLLDLSNKVKKSSQKEKIDELIGDIVNNKLSFIELYNFTKRYRDNRWAQDANKRILNIVENKPETLSYPVLEDIVLRYYSDAADKEKIYSLLIIYYDVELKNRDKTQEYIQKFLKEFPANKNVADYKVRISEIYIEKALYDRNPGPFDAATKYLEDIIQSYPNSPNAIKSKYLLATLYDGPNFKSPFPDKKKALDYYKEVLKDDPKGPFSDAAALNISQLR